MARNASSPDSPHWNMGRRYKCSTLVAGLISRTRKYVDCQCPFQASRRGNVKGPCSDVSSKKGRKRNANGNRVSEPPSSACVRSLIEFLFCGAAGSRVPLPEPFPSLVLIWGRRRDTRRAVRLPAPSRYVPPSHAPRLCSHIFFMPDQNESGFAGTRRREPVRAPRQQVGRISDDGHRDERSIARN